MSVEVGGSDSVGVQRRSSPWRPPGVDQLRAAGSTGALRADSGRRWSHPRAQFGGFKVRFLGGEVRDPCYVEGLGG